MGLPARLVRSQLNFFKPFVANCSLEVTRKGQDKLGEQPATKGLKKFSCERTSFADSSIVVVPFLIANKLL